MDCLHPSISARLALLVEGISAERRQAVLEIARDSGTWQDFLNVLQRGGFPLPQSPIPHNKAKGGTPNNN